MDAQTRIIRRGLTLLSAVGVAAAGCSEPVGPSSTPVAALFSISGDCAECALPEQSLTRQAGAPAVYEYSFPADPDREYRFVLTANDPGTRADFELNHQPLFSVRGMPPGEVTVPAALLAANRLRAVIAGKPGTGLTFRIEAVPLLPDLRVGSVSAPSPLAPGTRYFIEWMAINAGNAPAHVIHSNYYLSPDTTISSEDTFIGGEGGDLLSLAAGESRLRVDAIEIPPVQLPGEYYIGVVIDHLDEHAESDETKNIGRTLGKVVIGG